MEKEGNKYQETQKNKTPPNLQITDVHRRNFKLGRTVSIGHRSFFLYLVHPRLCKYIRVYIRVQEEEEEEEKGWVERSWNGRNFGLASPIQQPENYGHLPLW